jgi:MraZ protein
MLLTGTYERSLDEKFRVALPKAFRQWFGDQRHIVVTPGTDGCLALFSLPAFQLLAQRLAVRSPAGHDVRAFSRLLYAQAHTAELDGQGRIRVPAELARWAHLAGEVVLVGVGDHAELWNKARWEAYLAQMQPHYDELAEKALRETTVGISASSPAPDAGVENPSAWESPLPR